MVYFLVPQKHTICSALYHHQTLGIVCPEDDQKNGIHMDTIDRKMCYNGRL